MPGWLSSGGSGPLTWMLSNDTLIAWIKIARIKTAPIRNHPRNGKQNRT
jgi:hypothetical protein